MSVVVMCVCIRACDAWRGGLHDRALFQFPPKDAALQEPIFVLKCKSDQHEADRFLVLQVGFTCRSCRW
jgi:hypothetical protein